MNVSIVRPTGTHPPSPPTAPPAETPPPINDNIPTTTGYITPPSFTPSVTSADSESEVQEVLERRREKERRRREVERRVREREEKDREKQERVRKG